MPKVGVLALQGAFREHRLALERLGAEVIEVRLAEHLEGLAGVVIPGGESTTVTKLMSAYGFDTALKDFYDQGGAIWGTCGGRYRHCGGRSRTTCPAQIIATRHQRGSQRLRAATCVVRG